MALWNADALEPWIFADNQHERIRVEAFASSKVDRLKLRLVAKTFCEASVGHVVHSPQVDMLEVWRHLGELGQERATQPVEVFEVDCLRFLGQVLLQVVFSHYCVFLAVQVLYRFSLLVIGI